MNIFNLTTPPPGESVWGVFERLREVKTLFAERFILDHYISSGTDPTVKEGDGQHKKITLVDQVSAPSSIDDAVIIYNKAGDIYVQGNGRDTKLIDMSTGEKHYDLIKDLKVFSEDINGMAYGDGVYIVVGDNGYLAKSTDGSTWTTVDMSTTENFSGVEYLNGKFYTWWKDTSQPTLGYFSKLYYSTDGTSWTSMNVAAAISFISYFSGLFYVGRYGVNFTNGGIYSTSDFVTFTAKKEVSNGMYLSLELVNGNYYAKAIAGTTMPTAVLQRVTNNFSTYTDVHSVNYELKTYTIIYYHGYYIMFRDDEIYKSTDGVSFSLAQTSGGSSFFGAKIVGGKVYVMDSSIETVRSVMNNSYLPNETKAKDSVGFWDKHWHLNDRDFVYYNGVNLLSEIIEVG